MCVAERSILEWCRDLNETKTEVKSKEQKGGAVENWKLTAPRVELAGSPVCQFAPS